MTKVKKILIFIKYYIIFLIKIIYFHFYIYLFCKSKSNKRFCFIIASYNNEKNYLKNLNSVNNQIYKNFRVIYLNDNSTDDTLNKVSNYFKDKFIDYKIIDVKKRNGSLQNKYDAIHRFCYDDEIIISLDGDDNLMNKHVLTYLNNIYSKKDIFMTYGSYHSKSGKINFQSKYSKECINNNLFRDTFHPSHLRTYYTWLFKIISKENFQDNDGNFFITCEDRATMYPLVELAGEKHYFVPFYLLMYNDLNPIGLHKNDNLKKLKEKNKEIIKHKKKLEVYSG